MSDPAQRLLIEVEQLGSRRRVPLKDLWSAFYKVRPHLVGSVHAREELAELLSGLANAGAVTLPRNKRAYDATQKPPLPNWAQLPAPAATERALKRAAEIGWHPALSFVPKLDRLSDVELDELLAIQAFLREQPDAAEMTLRERSFQILGDEKRLEELLAGRLFRAGGLNLELLRCAAVRAPCVFREVGALTETGVLVVENKDTFHSACAAVRALGRECPIRWVVFGSGRAILTTIESVCDWKVRPEHAWYFGDLDAVGLEIALQVAELTRGWTPSLVMDCPGALYESLVGNAKARVRPLRGTRVTAGRAKELVSWLPEELRPAALELLNKGGRWPQEAVAGDELRKGLRRSELLPADGR